MNPAGRSLAGCAGRSAATVCREIARHRGRDGIASLMPIGVRGADGGPCEVIQAGCVVVFPVVGWEDGHDHEATQAHAGAGCQEDQGRANVF